MVTPNRTAEDNRTIVVSVTHRPPAPVLRYVDQIVGDTTPGFEFRYSQGVLTDLDVNVVHVPDSSIDLLLGLKEDGGRQRLIATWALIRNLRKHRIALVRTVDVPAVKGTDWSDRTARKMLDRATTTFIALDEFTKTPDASRSRVVPHATYSDRFVGYPSAQQIDGRVLCISRTYLPAAATALIDMIRVTETDGLTLRFVGRAHRVTAAHLRSGAARNKASVSVRFDTLSDGACVQEIDAAELVVFPGRIEGAEDRQALFLALSRNRPVIAQSTPVLDALSRELGSGWLHLVDGPITAKSIDDALSDARSGEPASTAPIEARGLAVTRAAYAEIYRRAAASHR